VNQSDDGEIDAKDPSNPGGEQPHEVPPQKNKQQQTWRAKNKSQQPMWRVKPINEDGRTTISTAATAVEAKAVTTAPATQRGGGRGSSSSKHGGDSRRQVKPMNEEGRTTVSAPAATEVEAKAVTSAPVTHRGTGSRGPVPTSKQPASDARREGGEVPIDDDEFPRLGAASFPKLGATPTKPQQRQQRKK